MASYSTGDLPVLTTDAFTDPGAAPAGALLLCPGAHQIVITVSGAAVVAQLGYGVGGAPRWENAPHFYVPGVWPISSRSGIDAVRLRSAARGVPATVSISAYV